MEPDNIINEYKYILILEDIVHTDTTSDVTVLFKNDIFELDTVVRMNPGVDRLFIRLKNGINLWKWEPNAMIKANFKLLTTGNLRNLKMQKIYENHKIKR